MTGLRWRYGRGSGQPDDAGPPALVVEHLTKRFGERVAVRDVSFSVGAGEVFGFLGPNGAGKTTTVRTLGTLIAPTSGSALVAGVPLEPENGVEIRQRISVMPENPGLYLRLTWPRTSSSSPASTACATRPRIERRSGGGQPRRPGRRSLRQPLERAAPAGRARPGAAQRPRDPLPRRADLGARPGRNPRGARADRRAAQQGVTSSSPPTGSRRPSGCATGSRSSTRRCARSAAPTSSATGSSPRRSCPDARPARRPRAASSPSRASRAGSRTARRLLADRQRARTRRRRLRARSGRRRRRCALARRGRHSLEDVYLELIDEDVEADADEHAGASAHRPQGAARVPPQPLHRRRRWRPPAGLPHHPADRHLRPASLGCQRSRATLEPSAATCCSSRPSSRP